MKRRILALLIGLCIVMLPLINGCGNTDGQSTENKGNDQGENGSSEREEKVKLVFFSNINVDTEGYDVNDNPYIKYVEEKNNIDLELINESTNYEQKLYAIMASGELPDFVAINSREDLVTFASHGLLMPLDDYLADYPDFVEKFEPISWELSKYDGKIYAIPAQRYDPTPLLAFARKEWVEQLGIDPTKSMTIDEWYNMLRAFTYDDPDKNGQNDTFGMTAMGEVDLTYTLFMDAFGAAKYEFVDGELRPNYILDGYKNWLKFMNKLYSEKILDPEYIVNTGTRMWEKTASGKYGVFQWFWSLMEHQTAGGKREDLVGLRPPLKEDGTAAGYLYTSPVRHYIGITTNCKNPEKVIDLQNWITSEEGKIYEFAGVEGFDYKYENGDIVFIKETAGQNMGWRNKTVGVMSPFADDTIKDILSKSYGSLAMEHLSLAVESGTFDELKLVAPVFDELADYDLDSKVKEFRDKAIIGQVDIDQEWDNFVQSWRSAGGNKFIELYTEWYKQEYQE
jgi:putative aldouronate transport system substrate-binding protein